MTEELTTLSEYNVESLVPLNESTISLNSIENGIEFVSQTGNTVSVNLYGNLPSIWNPLSNNEYIREVNAIGVSEIPNSFLENDTALENISGLDEISIIPSYAFKGCTSLSHYDYWENTIRIGDEAFSGSGITSVAVSDKATLISTGAFSDCKSLVNAVIDANIAQSRQKWFQNCSALKNYEAKGTKRYLAYVFENTTSLETATLGSVGTSVLGIANTTFKGDTQSNLSITIYKSNPNTKLQLEPWGATNATISYLQS